MIRAFAPGKIAAFAILLMAGISCQGIRSISDTPPGSGPSIVLLAGDEAHRSRTSLTLMAEILRTQHGFSPAVLSLPASSETTLRQALHQADLAVFFLGDLQLPESQLKALQQYLEQGKPAIGLRQSLAPFEYPKGHPLQTWNQVWGQRYWGKGSLTPSRYGGGSYSTVLSYQAAHPILTGVPDAIWSDAWMYLVEPLDARCAPLITGEATEGVQQGGECFFFPQTVAWTRVEALTAGHSSRRFYTTLGHPADFQQKGFRRMLINAMYWAMEKEYELPATGSRADWPDSLAPNPEGSR